MAAARLALLLGCSFNQLLWRVRWPALALPDSAPPDPLPTRTPPPRMQGVLASVRARDPAQPEFIQAVEEVILSLKPLLAAKPAYSAVLERLVEPERQIIFRVPWLDDAGNLRVNRGFRVQVGMSAGGVG